MLEKLKQLSTKFRSGLHAHGYQLTSNVSSGCYSPKLVNKLLSVSFLVGGMSVSSGVKSESDIHDYKTTLSASSQLNSTYINTLDYQNSIKSDIYESFAGDKKVMILNKEDYANFVDYHDFDNNDAVEIAGNLDLEEAMKFQEKDLTSVPTEPIHIVEIESSYDMKMNDKAIQDTVMVDMLGSDEKSIGITASVISGVLIASKARDFSMKETATILNDLRLHNGPLKENDLDRHTVIDKLFEKFGNNPCKINNLHSMTDKEIIRFAQAFVSDALTKSKLPIQFSMPINRAESDPGYYM